MREDRQPPRKRKRFATHAHAWSAATQLWGEPATSWEYYDRTGTLVGLVLRWEANGRKEIRPLALVEGGWVIGAMPAPRPIFRLELVASSAATNATVFVVEGEKAADAGRRLGLVCTTSSGGAAAAHLTDWSPLTGRNVVILPDNDEPGRKICRGGGVRRWCVCSRCRRFANLRLPNLPPGGDLADYVAAHVPTNRPMRSPPRSPNNRTTRRRSRALHSTAFYSNRRPR